MASSRQLTGGTGDVNPQLFQTPILNMIGANTFTETSIPLPQNRFFEKQGSVNVIEVLKVFFYTSEPDANNAAGGSVISTNIRLSTSSLPTIDQANPRVFAMQEKNYRGAFTAAGSYLTVISEPTALDLTDGAGHGLIIATDNVFLGMLTTGFTAAASGFAKILYRFKRVALAEYIGMVQSQQ